MARRKTYSVERAPKADRDLDVLFDFLVESHIHFGESRETAFEKAAARVHRIKQEFRALAAVPHRGTRCDAIIPGLRRVTKDHAVFYFLVEDELRVVRVLAVFFGGQDHQRQMLRRLMGEE